MASWVTVRRVIWVSFLKVLSSFLQENPCPWMTRSTGLSPWRGLSWLKADSWSDGLSRTYWNPPTSSRPGWLACSATTRARSTAMGSTAHRAGPQQAASHQQSPKHPRWEQRKSPLSKWLPTAWPSENSNVHLPFSSPGPWKSPYFDLCFPLNDRNIKYVRKIFLKR